MDAPIKWKVSFLRQVIAAPGPVTFPAVHESQEWHWFLDMKRDGYVDGEPGTTKEPPLNVITFDPVIPDCFVNVVATKEGKKFVDVYDSKTTWKGIWKTYHIPILLGIFSIIGAIITYFLIHAYFP
jgi:hypothetical protein